MAVVETYKIDGATVEIKDNSIKSKEESLERTERVTDIFYERINAQYRNKLKDKTA